MFDAATLREEVEAMHKRIEAGSRDKDLINRYMLYTRKLRDAEHRENGFVTARNSVTGY